MIVFYIIVAVAVAAATLITFEPDIDLTKEKHLLLWYNSRESRKFVRLW